MWRFVVPEPYDPDAYDQGVCISLAYCPSSDDIVVSHRPKFNTLVDVPNSQFWPTPYVTGQGVQGSHVLLKRTGCDNYQKMGSSNANVSDIRLPKCVIIDTQNQNRLFVSGDEATCDLVLQELPSFRTIQRFKMPAQVRDVRYSPSHGMLGCLTGNSLHLFRTNLKWDSTSILWFIDVGSFLSSFVSQNLAVRKVVEIFIVFQGYFFV